MKKMNFKKQYSVLKKTNRIAWEDHKKEVAIAVCISIVEGVVPIATLAGNAYAIKIITNGFITSTTTLIFASMLLAINGINTIVHFLGQTLKLKIADTIALDTDSKISKQIMLTDFPTHESHEAKNIIEQIRTKGPYMLLQLIIAQINISKSSIQIILALIATSIISPLAILAIMITVIPMAYTNAKISRYQYASSHERMPLERKASNLRQTLYDTDALAEIKVFQSEGMLSSILTSTNEEIRKSKEEMYNKICHYDLINTLLSYGGLITGLTISIAGLQDPSQEIATIVFAMGLLLTFQRATNHIAGDYGRSQERIIHMDNVITFMGMKSAIKENEDPIMLSSNTPAIEVKDLHFKYPSTTKETLKGISFKIEPGEKVAIIGENGVGKTTLIKLLCRFYDPTKGSIEIDGINLKEIKLSSWKDKISILFQRFWSMKAIKISEAINMSTPNREFSKVQADIAAKKASGYEMIHGLENEYDEVLGVDFKGIELSGGQWQKLALTKAHYKNPQVIILDEPTSAMDPKAERKIFDAIHDMGKETTAIFISHRLSTILEADKIIHIENGEIIGIGTHEQLLKNDPEYKKIYEMQMKKLKGK